MKKSLVTQLSRLSLSVLAFCMIASSVGCSALVWNKPKSQFDTTSLKREGYDVKALGSMSSMPSLPASQSPSIILEVHNNGRHLERIPLPSDRPWFVEDLVHEAQLQKRIGTLEIVVIRPMGEQKPPLVLEVGVSEDGKQINAGQNYSLNPNDHVVVRANNVGIFERMLPAYFTKQN